MKNVILLLLFVFIFNEVGGQILGQDREGFSTIIQPSSTFNLDLNEKIATLNYYHESLIKGFSSDRNYNSEEVCLIKSKTEAEYIKMLRTSWKKQEEIFKKTSIVYGVDLKGTSSDGLALLVKDEQLVTSASVSGLIGLSWQKRSYEYDNIDDYAKYSYRYRFNRGTEEKRYVKAIENELDKLLSQGVITEGKKTQLLRFQDAVSKDGEIEEIQNNIKSITDLRGFISPSQVEQNLKDRIKNLEAMEKLIPLIISDIGNYEAKIKANVDNDIYKALEVLKDRIAIFEKHSTNKSVKSIGLNLNYKKYKDLATWADIKTKLEEAIRTVGFDLYRHKKRVVLSISNTDVIKAYEAYRDYLKEHKLSPDKINEIKGQTYSIQKNLIYFKAGFSGTSFKYDTANDSISISDRFINKDFQGYRVELGYSSQLKRYNFFGFNMSMSRTSNVNNLTSTTYKFEQIDTSVAPNISTAHELKALSGAFDTFFRFGVNFDYVRLFPFYDSNASEEGIKKSKLLLSVNPYVRHYFYDGSNILKPNTSLGVGLYSFNKESGSIAGGLFIQADDIFNVNRDRAINFTKQISFGVIFKVAIKNFDPES